MRIESTLTIFSIILFGTIACQQSGEQKEEPKDEVKEVASTMSLELKWSTDSTMTTSESSIYYATDDVIFVSNINGVPPAAKDGDGFISKISTSGEVIEQKWVEGLDAPKGMGILDGKLYVTNITELVEIDIARGEVTNRWAIEDAQFLNDITISADGGIYISDSYTNKIHLAKDGAVSTWLSDSTLGGPNGLLHLGDKMVIASFGSGEFKQINTSDMSTSVINGETPGGDGIVAVGDGFLVSNWNGEIAYIDADGDKTLLLDTKGKAHSADISFIAEKNLLLVPTFFDNKIVAYELKM